MSAQDSEKNVPKVLIVGGGLGGLLLATLLERSNTPYHVFERAAKVEPLGSVVSLGAGILPVFEQLGLMKEIEKVSLPFHGLHFFDAELQRMGHIDMKQQKSISGYDNLFFLRPKLHDLLLQQVPSNNISFGKKFVRSGENQDGKIQLHFSDNTTFEGDILVGADGANSSVRQNLYKRLDKQGLLPKDDLKTQSIGYTCMVGVSEPKNPERYPQLKDKVSNRAQVLAKERLSWSVSNAPDNKIGWELGIQFSEEEVQSHGFGNCEWNPESNDAMIKEFQDMPCPWGGTMGDIIKDTPAEYISKVFLEEKMYETWYHDRTVLLGDACHKMLPGAGQAVINAMQDAVVLANCFYSMVDTTPESITAAFQEYYRQRFQRSEAVFKASGAMSKFVFDQTWTNRVTRHVVLNYIPEWVQRMAFTKGFEYRPQIAWLPLAENHGTGQVLPQESARKDSHAPA